MLVALALDEDGELALARLHALEVASFGYPDDGLYLALYLPLGDVIDQLFDDLERLTSLCWLCTGC